jgi:hypothetical protein
MIAPVPPDDALAAAVLELLAAQIAGGSVHLLGIGPARAWRVQTALARELAVPPQTPLVLVVLTTREPPLEPPDAERL